MKAFVVSRDEFLYACIVEICRQSIEPSSSLFHRYSWACRPKTASSVWTSENHLEPGPDCREDPIFQVFSDEGRALGLLLIVNICPALIKYSTPFSHIWLVHYTFPIHWNKLMVNFNGRDIFCIQKPNYCSHFTLRGIFDFLTNF
jgi:hypothetical protein